MNQRSFGLAGCLFEKSGSRENSQVVRVLKQENNSTNSKIRVQVLRLSRSALRLGSRDLKAQRVYQREQNSGSLLMQVFVALSADLCNMSSSHIRALPFLVLYIKNDFTFFGWTSLLPGQLCESSDDFFFLPHLFLVPQWSRALTYFSFPGFSLPQALLSFG